VKAKYIYIDESERGRERVGVKDRAKASQS